MTKSDLSPLFPGGKIPRKRVDRVRRILELTHTADGLDMLRRIFGGPDTIWKAVTVMDTIK